MSLSTAGRRRQDRIVAWTPVLFLLLLAALTVWLDFTISRAVVDRHKPGANSPEQFLENFTALRYDAQGALTQQLKAERGTYFPQMNRTVVEKPHFTNQPPQGAQMTVRANKAIVHGKNDRIDFAGNVRAQQPEFEGQPARVLETESLTAVPATGDLSTQAAVKISQANAVVETKGLRANSKTQQFSGQGPARIVLQPKEK